MSSSLYELPGPRSRALAAREQAVLAPGIQQIATLSGVAFDRGEGALLCDVDGNTFIDFVAGVGVASLGHAHPALARALGEQAARLTSGSFTSEARVRLCERIAAATRTIGSGALGLTQLYSGGAEAVESALRLARAHTGRHEVIAFHGAFHGKTAGVLGLMGSDFKHGLGPFLPGQHTAPYPDGKTTGECIDFLNEIIDIQTSGQLAAILVEPMQGTAGNVIPPPDFLPALADVARARGALIVVDEMITGWGRTGRLFGVEHSGVEPDILVFGKGVAGGQPVSGLVTSERVLRRADPWTRPSFSSSSYGGSPLGCAAADAVTRVIVEERLPAHAAEVGAAMLEGLERLQKKHPVMRAVRGAGLFLGVDLDLDRAGSERLFHACLRRGLLTMAYSPRLRINPPLVITRAQALDGLARLDDALGSLACTS
ncbi:MAG TPA: aminotransferase class III-fold pyridoxal phosphate-dependent enzyme [Kofleriaceae bacterium]|nr:aminotransferase class III-fold pyridoxal phosphate-dependent enzyme [Kofleriaceae bacterium]